MPKGELIVKGRFEWFSEKDELNRKNHNGISFDDILSVFDDPYFYEIYDKTHSEENQDRYIGFGYADGFYVVQVSYTEGKRIHLISARPATGKEREMYFERLRKIHGGM